MGRVVIVGSGPAAAGAALALARDATQQITVIDIGHRLEEDRRGAIARLASQAAPAWDPADVGLISRQPVGRAKRGLPEKRAYGSDFPFRDVGQLEGVSAVGQANGSVISGAYGGFSNVWGAQVMAFTPATFADWPVTATDMEPHYKAALAEIPYAAEEDALAGHFPLIANAGPLPPLAPRTRSVLTAASRHRRRLDRLGVVVGRARLAFDSDRCIRCGLCMTGCPYSLIYSSSQTFDRLRRDGRIDYRDNLLAVDVGQDAEVAYVVARQLGSATAHRFEAERVYVAAGALGTTRLVLGSLRLFGQDLELAESVQFAVPMLSLRPVADPALSSEFTLNQFNMVVSTDEQWRDVSQIHFYPHNPSILDALPKALRARWAAATTSQLLRRLTVGLGYLPSWVSPPLRVLARRPRAHGELPDLIISGDAARGSQIPMFRQVVRKVVQAAPRLDLWPV
ncbi:MAG TPA: 4Fe-4S binding protein, partial [Acidimicrobiales bacterium]|nr:4Fe-4S binding protein [Acidimicrobiales bacterium]